MSVTILLAMLLHVGGALLLSIPEPKKITEPVTPLRVNLLATVAETTVVASRPESKPLIKPKPMKPKQAPIKPKQTPVKPTLAKTKPVIEQRVAKQAVVKEPALPSHDEAEISADPIVAVADAVATARYEKLLVAWLEKHKQYPRRAKRLRIEGEGMLRILIDRDGQTLKISLEQRTGNRLLDKAALEMAQRANPFPEMPANDPRNELEFIVPVAFVLR